MSERNLILMIMATDYVLLFLNNPMEETANQIKQDVTRGRPDLLRLDLSNYYYARRQAIGLGWNPREYDSCISDLTRDLDFCSINLTREAGKQK